MKPTEKQIQQVIINYLKYRGFYVQRMNSGAIKTERGGLVRLAAKGTPDIIAFKGGCIHHYQDHVELLFIEVKRPGKKPTPAQTMMMEELTQYGARCIVATCLEDVEKAL